MRKLKDTLLIILLLLIGIPLTILAVPFVLVGWPIGYFQRKKFQEKYAEFLIRNDGKNFLFYNNRKNSEKYIEEEIIPYLNTEIEIVYLNGKKIESNFNYEFISAALFGLKHYNKFPHVLKIRNGQLIDESVNNLFYGVLNMNKSKPELLNKINQFFELNGE